MLKTGNVLSDNNIFNVNNIEISKENSENKEKLVNKAFKKAFNKLISTLVKSADIEKTNNIKLNEIRSMIESFSIKEENKYCYKLSKCTK